MVRVVLTYLWTAMILTCPVICQAGSHGPCTGGVWSGCSCCSHDSHDGHIQEGDDDHAGPEGDDHEGASSDSAVSDHEHDARVQGVHAHGSHSPLKSRQHSSPSCFCCGGAIVVGKISPSTSPHSLSGVGSSIAMVMVIPQGLKSFGQQARLANELLSLSGRTLRIQIASFLI